MSVLRRAITRRFKWTNSTQFSDGFSGLRFRSVEPFHKSVDFGCKLVRSVQHQVENVVRAATGLVSMPATNCLTSWIAGNGSDESGPDA